MRAPRPGRDLLRRRPRGFTLLKLASVFLVVSLVVAVAVPIGRTAATKARARAVAEDLRTFRAAFESYAAEHGDWPAGDGAAGAIPDGMEARLAKTKWEQRTPIGGRYAWDPNGVHRGARHRAAIVIAGVVDDPVRAPSEQLQAIDRALDDGDLGTGNFALGYRDYPVFVLEH